jgi:hypothetical protein
VKARSAKKGEKESRSLAVIVTARHYVDQISETSQGPFRW